MKKVTLLLTLTLALCLPSAMLAQTAGGQMGGAPMQGKKTPTDDPNIRKALGHLQQAKASLAQAEHDFDGHRSAAQKAVEDAIRECQQALKAAHNK